MIRKHLHTFDGPTSTGFDTVPLNQPILIESDGNGNPQMLMLIDKTGITSATTASDLLLLTAQYKSLGSSDFATLPKTIYSGETKSVPTDRQVVVSNITVENGGELLIEGTGEVAVIGGGSLSQSVMKTDSIETVSTVKTIPTDNLVKQTSGIIQDIDGVALYADRGLKNYFINGGYDVWQRGTAFTDGGYTADRWYSRYKSLTGATTYTIQKLFSTLNGNYLKFDVAGATSTWYHFQKIENPYIFSGKTMTLSMKQMNCTVGVDFNLRCTLNTTVDGEINLLPSTLFFTTVDTTSGAVVHSKTITIPDLSAYTIDANSSLQVGIYTPTTITDGTYRFTQWQFEEGSIATPFEQRPIGLEEMLCERYYQTYYLSAYHTLGVFRGGSGGVASSQRYSFKTPMRIAPTFIGSITSGAMYDVKDSFAGNDLTNVTFSMIAYDGKEYRINGSHASALNGAYYATTMTSSSATVTADAEL